MSHYQFKKDYQNDRVKKESFNELAKITFDIDFSRWYERGYWNDDYICYSFFDGDKIIANVSVNEMTIVMNDVRYKALQIGTVMTDKNYRNQGLSAQLLQKVFEEYDDAIDFMYLFANDGVIDFYPKFGFTRVVESNYAASATEFSQSTNLLRRLNIEDETDRLLLEDYAKNYVIQHNILDIERNEHLKNFYFTIVFSELLFYDKVNESIVIYEIEEDALHVYGIVAKQTIDERVLIEQLVTDEVKNVHIYFMPTTTSTVNWQTSPMTETDDLLFVRGKNFPLHTPFIMPLISHA